MNVTVTPTGPGGHLTAYLYAVDEEDKAERLGWGQVDLRYARGGPVAETVVPGEPVDVDLPVEPLDAVVPAGQRLALVLHQGTVGGRTYSPTPTPVVVETGGENAVDLRAWGGDVGAGGAGGVLVGTRDVDSSIYTAGEVSYQTIAVEAPTGGRVRDVVPPEWTVLAERSDAVSRVGEGDGVQYVHFDGAASADGETTFQYLLEAPARVESTNYYEFGPAECRQDGEWTAVEGTGGEAFVVGADS